MQTRGRVFDELARMANGALSVAAGMRDEIRQRVDQRFERFLADRDLVTREEFEAVAAMAARARQAQDALEARLAALEAKSPPAPKRKANTAARPGTGRGKTRTRKTGDNPAKDR